MATPGRRRKQMQAAKAQRLASQRASGQQSNYARKAKYLARNELWGSDVPEPKPWKRR